MVFIPQAEVDRKLGRDLPVILPEKPVVAYRRVKIRPGVRNCRVDRNTQQKVSPRLPGERAVKGVVSEIVSTRENCRILNGHVADVRAPLHDVLAAAPCHVVGKLDPELAERFVTRMAGCVVTADRNVRHAAAGGELLRQSPQAKFLYQFLAVDVEPEELAGSGDAKTKLIQDARCDGPVVGKSQASGLVRIGIVTQAGKEFAGRGSRFLKVNRPNKEWLEDST